MKMLACRMFAVLWLLLTVTQLANAVETADPSGAAVAELEVLKAKAERGDAESQCNLGSNYMNGVGVAKDDAEALKWYRKAAEQGNAVLQNMLGLMYGKGQGVAKDDAEAAKWFRKSAEQGNAFAQHILGTLYARGQGVPKDEAEALKWFRKPAESGDAIAQHTLGAMYFRGQGVVKDEWEASKWWGKAAEQGYAIAQSDLGGMYIKGQGVAKDYAEALKWYRKAAEQGEASAQNALGLMYDRGLGVAKDEREAAKWFRKAAEQGYANAQYLLGVGYANGQGVAKDDVEAYKWLLLATANGEEKARPEVTYTEKFLTPDQRIQGQRMAREFKPRDMSQENDVAVRENVEESRPKASGSGFFITDDGYFITNQHVADSGATVRVGNASGIIPAKVIKVDELNDLTLLKAEGKYAALPVALSRGVQLGATVATVGFPNIGLQGFSPKLAKGEIASLAGIQDDARHFQISVPVQPGNSGGALVDERGNVIGVVVAKLSQRAAIATTGTLAENVNYAIKSSYLLSFLESVPEVAAKLKDPNTTERNFEAIIKSVEQAAVLVLVY